jgi:hypothetical protein
MRLNNFLKINSSRTALTIGAVFVLALIFPLNQASAVTITPRIEINSDPGKTVVENVKISNEERQSRTYYLSIQNFESQDESGNPRFSNRREDLATWVELPETFTVGPGETKELELTIRIPSEVEPGGHFAAIFFTTSPPSESDSGLVGVSSKLGSLILLRVSGDFVQDASLLEFATKNKQRFFTALPVHFYYRFQNIGEDHVRPVGDVIITNSLGRTAKILPANPVDGSVLPKSIRRFETVWATSFGPLEQGPSPELPKPSGSGFWDNVTYEWQNFAFGKYTAKASIVFGTKELKSARDSFSFYVLPWHLLLVVLISLTILFIISRFSIKRYNRYIIAKAQATMPLKKPVSRRPRKKQD